MPTTNDAATARTEALMGSASEIATYGDLKAALDKLTPDQLEQQVVWTNGGDGGRITGQLVLPEDYVSVGEGLEPESVYLNDPNFKPSQVTVRMPAGSVFLISEDEDEDDE